MKNVPDRSMSYTDFLGNLPDEGTGRSHGSYLAHEIISQLVATLRLSASYSFRVLMQAVRGAVGLAAFPDRIPSIVKICSKKQMVRIGTGRIIARMKHIHTVRDRPAERRIGEPMCGDGLFTVINLAIAPSLGAPCPAPTTIRVCWDDYLFPETINRGTAAKVGGAFPRAAMSSGGLSPMLWLKLFSTPLTKQCNHLSSQKVRPSGWQVVAEATRLEPLGRMNKESCRSYRLPQHSHCTTSLAARQGPFINPLPG